MEIILDIGVDLDLCRVAGDASANPSVDRDLGAISRHTRIVDIRMNTIACYGNRDILVINDPVPWQVVALSVLARLGYLYKKYNVLEFSGSLGHRLVLELR